MPDTLPINFFNMSVFLGADFIFPAKSDLPASDSICDTPRQSQHRNKPEIRSVIGVGLMEKLKELIGEYDGDNDEHEGTAGLEDAAGEAEEAEADEAEGSEEEAAADDDGEAEEPASPKRASAPKHAKKAVRGRKKVKPESEAGNAEESEQEEMHDDEKDGLAELQAKVEKLEKEVAASKGGKTGLEPAGTASTTDADVKRWREIAGLED